MNTPERPDRNDPPGLDRRNPIPHIERARQLIEHYIESTAVHSRSRGWIPTIAVTLTHVPLTGVGLPTELLLILEHDVAADFIAKLTEGLDAAKRDAAVGWRPDRGDN